MTVAVAALDLGASSGRAVVGRVAPDELELVVAARFDNEPLTVGGVLHWDILNLYRGLLEGLRRAGPVRSVGIDSWAVDYGLLDGDGRLLGNPIHYRDSRTAGVMDKVVAEVGAAELYRVGGLQLLPFNTIFQLVAARDTAQFAAARTLLLIPDLLAYWLTGELGAERTNASTTGLLDVRSGDWSLELMRRLGLDAAILPAIREPGSAIGPLLPAVATSIGAEAGTQVTAVASHDTASAIVAVPAQSDRFAYISCGTWSLVGMELTGPVLSEASQAANFTNEIGVDGTVRYLRNVMGLWPLQECLRSWQATGGQVELPALLELAAEVPPFANVVDLDDPVFLPPGDMPARLVTECRRLEQRGPTTPAEVVRCVLDSLALAHRRAVADVQQLTGRAIDTVHIVGGGARNELLCQLTADACDLPVVAGPQEATAMGNVLIQARALGAIPPELTQLRALVRRTQPMRTFSPQGNPSAWRAAANRIAGSRS